MVYWFSENGLDTRHEGAVQGGVYGDADTSESPEWHHVETQAIEMFAECRPDEDGTD